jgi:hypothetical protein
MKMGQIGLLALYLLIQPACSGNKGTEVAPMPIPEQKLVGILVDFQIADAAMGFVPGMQGPGSRVDRKAIHLDILKKAGFTSAQLDTSLNRLGKNPEKLKQVYEKVLESIMTTRAEKKKGGPTGPPL